MATFPRAFEPSRVSPIDLPGGLISESQAGIIDLRASQKTGWRWEEEYELVSPRTAAGRSLLAFIRRMKNRVETHDATHPLTPGSGLARNGAGTPAGAITVSGAGQTGNELVTTGWPTGTTGVVAAGDVIEVGGRVFEVYADADSDGSGDCTIPVTPNIFAAPADGATVTITGVTFSVCLIEPPSFSPNTAPDYFSFSLKFAEVLPR